MVKNLPLGGGVALLAAFNPFLVFCPVNLKSHLCGFMVKTQAPPQKLLDHFKKLKLLGLNVEV
jgi:hypothetical protein